MCALAPHPVRKQKHISVLERNVAKMGHQSRREGPNVTLVRYMAKKRRLCAARTSAFTDLSQCLSSGAPRTSVWQDERASTTDKKWRK